MSAPAKAAKPLREDGKTRGADLSSLALNLVGLVAGVAGWWVLTASGAVGLPPPPDVERKFGELIANGQLATDILSSLARVLTGFLLQWPTLLTLASYPVLVWAYARLARREEGDSLRRFGDDYARYMQEVPAFLPRRRRGPAPPQGEA